MMRSLIFSKSTVSGHSLFETVLPREPLVLPSSHPCSTFDLASDAQGRNDHFFDFTDGRSTVQHYRNCRIIERNAGDTRADAGIINVSWRQYIDVAVANPAALTYRPKPLPSASGLPIPVLPGSSNAFQVRSEQKKSRYHPIRRRGGHIHALCRVHR